jgi:hypothetical protein
MKVIPETYLMKVIPETRRTWWRLFQKRTWWRLFQKRTWWRLFQKHVVPDEGYSRNVPDEGYSRHTSYLMKVIPETRRTWWRLFQKRVVRTKFDIYVLLLFIFIANRVFKQHCFTGRKKYTYSMHFQQYFSSIVAVSFINGGNRKTTDLS